MAEEVKVPLVTLRGMFIGSATQEYKDKGYFKRMFFNIIIKQDGVAFLVKRIDEKTKGESKLRYENFSDFTKEWTIFKY